MTARSGSKGGGGKSGAARGLHVRVKTAKKRTVSSARWLERQLNDPYVAAAKRDGYRSRAAYKLIEMDDKLHVLRAGAVVVDLGAAPGGWCQVASERVRSRPGDSAPNGKVVGIDLTEVVPVPGAEVIQFDFLAEDAPERLRALLGGPADVVLSDMAAAATGHKATDHLKIMALCEAALDFAVDVLKPGGAFIAKVLQGGSENQLMATMRKHFAVVKHMKPPASRSDSSEMYVVATGFRA
ncbi:RlmE family RNA methyltransferase [Zavarzinia compransoris]|uniref:RlmE family RNA methyltransferase n=1 Tax=Zavarzinia marina TaxID=2911065 RepID=UPI001F3D92EF|nr:RlmE family RNA methyltransferase [Zavarzinia marina]MCF4165002.1 RlmE family RNA methyltransferase [Zavarzinia marina]